MRRVLEAQVALVWDTLILSMVLLELLSLFSIRCHLIDKTFLLMVVIIDSLLLLLRLLLFLKALLNAIALLLIDSVADHLHWLIILVLMVRTCEIVWLVHDLCLSQIAVAHVIF